MARGYIAVMSAIAEKLWMLQHESAKRVVQDFDPINIRRDRR